MFSGVEGLEECAALGEPGQELGDWGGTIPFGSGRVQAGEKVVIPFWS